MKKIAVMIEDQYETLEAWYPYLRLQEAGYMPVFMGSGRKKEYMSEQGYPAPEELSAKDAETDEFEGVVIAGGYGPDKMRRSKEMIAFVKNMAEEGKLVAAICHAGWMLVSAGLLKDRKATGYPSIKDDMVNAGAEYVDREVVVDGNIITSRSPDDLPSFCTEILKFVEEKSQVREEAPVI